MKKNIIISALAVLLILSLALNFFSIRYSYYEIRDTSIMENSCPVFKQVKWDCLKSLPN